MEFAKSGKRRSGLTEFHSGAGRRIKHPAGNLYDYTRLYPEQSK